MESEEEDCILFGNSQGSKRLKTTMLLQSSKKSPCRGFSEDERLLDDVQGLPTVGKYVLPNSCQGVKISRSLKLGRPEVVPLSGDSSTPPFSEPGCSSGVKARSSKRDSNKSCLGGEGISSASIEMYEEELKSTPKPKMVSKNGEQDEVGVAQLPKTPNHVDGQREFIHSSPITKNKLSYSCISGNKKTVPSSPKLYNSAQKKDFNKEKDLVIIYGVLEANFQSVGGHVIYRHIFSSNKILLDHTPSSVRERFRKKILPNIQHQLLTGKLYYPLSQEVLDQYQKYIDNRSDYVNSSFPSKVLPETLDKHIVQAIIQDRPGDRLHTVYWTQLLKDLQVENKSHVLLTQRPQQILSRIMDFIIPRMGDLEEYVAGADLKKMRGILVDKIYDDEDDYMKLYEKDNNDGPGSFVADNQVGLRKRRSSNSDSSLEILGEYPNQKSSKLLMIGGPSVKQSTSNYTKTKPKIEKRVSVKVENILETTLKIDAWTQMDARKLHNVGKMVQPETRNVNTETITVVEEDYNNVEFDSTQEEEADDPCVSYGIKVMSNIFADLKSNTEEKAKFAKNIISQLFLYDAMVQLARDQLYRH